MLCVKFVVMLFISMLILNCMIDFIKCGNKRVRIFVPEHIRHVHHHHVRKVPVYIVTKDRPRVMHATHIEDDDEDVSEDPVVKRSPRTRAAVAGSYDDDDHGPVIRGIYHRGDENLVHQTIVDDGGAVHGRVPYVLVPNSFERPRPVGRGDSSAPHRQSATTAVARHSSWSF